MQRRPARRRRRRSRSRVAVHAQHVEHVRLVVGEPGERPHPAGGAGAGGVGVTGHQRGERRRPRPTLGRVVGQAEGHQQRAEVGVADAELAELAAGLGDRLGRVVGPADEDLLRGEHRPRRCACRPRRRSCRPRRGSCNRLIDARLHAELSRCMYSLHGLEPLMRPVAWAVCHLLIVVSNCRPGSAHSHDAWRSAATGRGRARCDDRRPSVTATQVPVGVVDDGAA